MTSATMLRDQEFDRSGAARERLAIHGPSGLSEEELLALVLGGQAGPRRARALLAAHGELRALASAFPEELCEIRGIGRAAASAVVAAFELGRRSDASVRPRGVPLQRPGEVIDFARARLRGATQEHFEVIGLDARQRVCLVRTVAMGSLAQVDVHPRELFRPLLRAGVHACILVHNHPSGDAEPSRADIELTRRMCRVGELVGLPVLDHLVVSDDDAVSLASLGYFE